MEVINNCREKKFPREQYKVGFHCQPRWSRQKRMGKRAYSAGLQGRGPGQPFPLVHMDVKIQVLMHRIGRKRGHRQKVSWTAGHLLISILGYIP